MLHMLSLAIFKFQRLTNFIRRRNAASAAVFDSRARATYKARYSAARVSKRLILHAAAC